MFSLKWARKEILTEQNVDFLFRFACREINTLDNTVVSIKQLLESQFPEIFSHISLDELEWLSPRVMIVVDGLDELNGIYNMDSQISGTAAASQLLDPTTQQRITNIFQMIMPNKDFLKSHKSIVCGRPRACGIAKSVLHNSKNRTKTVEVCGFSPENLQRYITKFFRFEKTKEKADRVRQAIKTSSDLHFMASVPVFLWVICNVYGEDLLTKEVQSKTELYLYTTIVFMRNHLRTLSKYDHKDLFQLVGDEEFLKILLSLATLSVETYMYNKVLFTEDDINKLNCPIHLEKTGFIIKTSGKTKVAKSFYQFRHLVLHEFLCALYLCVSKDLERFNGNRELTSCTASMLGIERLMNQKGNCLFTYLFKNLFSSFRKKSFVKHIPLKYSLNWFDDSTSKSYKCYIADRKRELTIPDSLVKDQTLDLFLSPYTSEIREFLDNVYESKYVNAGRRKFKSARLRFTKALCRKTVFLLQVLDIQHIEYLEYVMDEIDNLNFSEDLMNLIKMCVGKENIVMEIRYEKRAQLLLACRHGRLTVRMDIPNTIDTTSRFVTRLPMKLTKQFEVLSSELYLSLVDINHFEKIVYIIEDFIVYANDSKKRLEIEVAEELQQEYLQTYSNLSSERKQLFYIHFK